MAQYALFTNTTQIPGFDSKITDSYQVFPGIAFEKTYAGIALVQCDSSTNLNKYRAPNANKMKVVMSGDFVTSNSIACTVNGVSLIATVFGTDHATTMAALGAKIEAAANTRWELASATEDATGRTFYIYRDDDVDASITVTVTLGAGQATATYTYLTYDLDNTTSKSITGVTLFNNSDKYDADAANLYRDAEETISIKGHGAIMNVLTETSTSQKAAVYVRFKANGTGKLIPGAFRTDSDSGNCVLITNCRWSETRSPGCGSLQINVV